MQPLGEQELDLLRYVIDNAPISVKDTLAGYGEEKGLARTTVLTMMERLRLKGYLTREEAEGANLYSPLVSKKELMTGVVRRFVDKALGGSLSPFVSYLADAKLSKSEIDNLKRLLDQMEPDDGSAPKGD